MLPVSVSQAFALAVQHHRAGRMVEAEALYRQILAVEPRHAEVCNNLGIVLAGQARWEEAVASYRRALELRPDFAEAHNNLGNALKAQARLDEAIDAYRRALQIKADYPEACLNLGIALMEQGRWTEAEEMCRRADVLRPNSARTLNVLGAVLAGQGQFDQAIAAYGRALVLTPGYLEAQINLGIALAELRRIDEAIAVYRRALELKPDSAAAWAHLGNALWARGRGDEAVSAYRRAIQFQPDLPEAHNYLGFVLKDRGEAEEAATEFRRAVQIKPDYREAHSNLIYTLPFVPGTDEAGMATEKQRWSRQFAEPLQHQVQPHVHNRDPERRLRIGYVSADFRDHVIGRYIWPLLQGHARQNFEVLCYSGVARPDGFTEKMRPLVSRWRDTLRVRDEAMAEKIREDGVDILVDLTQHMAGDRLGVFARQPAPVQVSFGGTTESTSLGAIRYRISDRYLEEATNADSERVCLVDSFWCYDPLGVEVAVNEMPALKNGGVTFGTLNNFCKINERLLRLWGQVLGQVESSRLILLSPAGSHRQRVLAKLEGEGIGSQRVEFVELRPRKDYLELYHRLDIALDPFPYHGHSTSLDALWMGVPVVSLAGRRPASRAGCSQLVHVGLPELLAFSEADYVRIAVQLAHDPPRLAELRRTLRSRMEASPLMDAARFVRGIESAYRAMWRKWCTESAPAPR